MKFTLQDIGAIAEDFLVTLDSHKIQRVEDLAKRSGQSIKLNSTDSIEFDLKDHESEGRIGVSYIASYCRKDAGIPIELRVNDIAGFGLVIAKAQEIIPGYTPFSGHRGDRFGNIYQSVENRQAGFPWIIEELEKLKMLKG